MMFLNEIKLPEWLPSLPTADDVMESILKAISAIFTTIIYKTAEAGIYIWNGFVDTIMKIITLNPFDEKIDSVWSAIDSFSAVNGVNVMTTVAEAVLVFVWLVGLLKMSADFDQGGTSPLQKLGFSFARLFIPLAFIHSYKYVVGIIINQGYSLMKNYGLTGMKIDMDSVKLALEESNTDVIAQLGDAFLGGIFGLAFIIMVIATIFTIITQGLGRFFKLIVVIVLAPIAFAFWGAKGTEHIPIRYLENVGKIVIQGLVFILILIIYSTFSNQIGTILSNFDFLNEVGEIKFFVSQILMLGILQALFSSADQLVERIA